MATPGQRCSARRLPEKIRRYIACSDIRKCSRTKRNGHRKKFSPFLSASPLGPTLVSQSVLGLESGLPLGASLLRPGGGRIEVDDGLWRRRGNHGAHVGTVGVLVARVAVF